MTSDMFALEFSEFIKLNPSSLEMAEWNRNRMMKIRSNDPQNAAVYATEVARWSLSANDWRRNWA